MTALADPTSDWLENAWATRVSTHNLEVEGARVYYRGWGLDQVDRPGLIFIHGFLAHAYWWDHIAPHLTDRFRVAAINLTGMGDSDRREVYSRQQYAREILAVAADAGMARTTLVAHSFGAISSLYAGLIAPDVVDRIIVIDAKVFRTEYRGSTPVPPERFYRTLEEGIERYRLTPPGAWANPRILAYLAKNSLRETPRGWTWKFDPETFRTARKESVSDALRDLPLPVDLVHGSNSEMLGRAEIEIFLRNMPSCGMPVQVPLSHHHVMIEQPVGLVAALNGLLSSPRQRS